MPPRQFSFAEITIATNNFDESKLLGAGGEGKVFKGIIQIDGVETTVAVKLLKSTRSCDRFHEEIEVVSRFNHRNLLSLIGYCDESNHKILVYEFAARGSLAGYLYRYSNSTIDWEKLVNIAIDTARALEDLHSGTSSQHKIIHRDVKPGNILLDKNWGAKISDFGLLKRVLSRPKPQESTDPINTDLKGTFGYYDPQYVFKKQVTTKTDVYSFGVVMLEMLCRKKREWPLHDESSSRGSTKEEEIGTWARKNIAPDLKSQISDGCLEKFIDIARGCLLRDPKQRPSMATVVSMLEVAKKLQNQKGSKYEAYKTEHSHCSVYEALPTGHSQTVF